MLTQCARFGMAISLMLSASMAAPAWSIGTSGGEHKCTAKHRHVKRVVVAAPERGVTIIEHRKQDVQILSFGP